MHESRLLEELCRRCLKCWSLGLRRSGGADVGTMVGVLSGGTVCTLGTTASGSEGTAVGSTLGSAALLGFGGELVGRLVGIMLVWRS